VGRLPFTLPTRCPSSRQTPLHPSPSLHHLAGPKDK